MAARAGAEPKKIVADGFNTNISWNSVGKTLVFERTSVTMPVEVFAAASDGSGTKQITRQNDAILASLEMNAPETFWFAVAGGTRVQAMMIRPPKFDAKKKYPLVVILHGGPPAMCANALGFPWDAQIVSAAGYLPLKINRRGSTGYPTNSTK